MSMEYGDNFLNFLFELKTNAHLDVGNVLKNKNNFEV